MKRKMYKGVKRLGPRQRRKKAEAEKTLHLEVASRVAQGQRDKEAIAEVAEMYDLTYGQVEGRWYRYQRKKGSTHGNSTITLRQTQRFVMLLLCLSMWDLALTEKEACLALNKYMQWELAKDSRSIIRRIVNAHPHLLRKRRRQGKAPTRVHGAHTEQMLHMIDLVGPAMRSKRYNADQIFNLDETIVDWPDPSKWKALEAEDDIFEYIFPLSL